ncbi:4-coumarate--CoA ligase-like 4 [Rhynchospora pubera]|uniref:4-coumarate--CoA ligase n=1 Tax=Rhynchospora pubera TaxID=906938 RepID=A0AAV8EV38_9POAL|nr:4-coumarate--CoA ligase-like 4 [Rhynchospora pubera]
MPPPSIDPRSGFCPTNRTFYSLRPETPLPPESFPISAAEFALSLLGSSSLPLQPALIDAFSSASLSFPSLLSQSSSLATALCSSPFNLSPGSVAFILSPSRLEISVLYLALISIGVVVSPANPASSLSEISHQIGLCKPSIAFSVSSVASKIPSEIPILLLDSPFFTSILSSNVPNSPVPTIKQSDTAAILYSSGTTGRVKGVILTHRNLIACIADQHTRRSEKLAEAAAAGETPSQTVALFTIPLFHVFGFFMLFRAIATGETTVLMERFEFGAMLRAIEKYKVTIVPAAPPLIVALAKSPDVLRFDLSSLQTIGVGGAPLGRELAQQFIARFPNVDLVQGYGLTESGGSVSVTVGPEESKMYGSAGRLGANLEAKIVDPSTGEALGPGQRGELCIRGLIIMKGYVGDDEATSSTLDREGWLKTGDLCYINEDGFLYIVDRLKELIKYKAYQVPPAELELILHTQPGIADAAVVPYPDEEAGEIPMAFVVRQPGIHLTEKEIMDFVAKQVAPYKKIRRVAFVNAIPKSPAGKILRRELVQNALSKPPTKL